MRKVYLNYKNRRAFTLIELMVVVAIIGILATMIVINLQGAQKKSRDTKRKSDASMIMSAIVMYGSDHGGVLPDATKLTTATNIVAIKWIKNSLVTGNLHSLIVGNGTTTGGYMTNFPCDPKGCSITNFTGYAYYRDSSSTRKGYVYTSLEITPTGEDVLSTAPGSMDVTAAALSDIYNITTDIVNPRPSAKFNFKLSN